MENETHIYARVVVQLKGENFLGPGRVDLMEKIHASGSIAEAAREMGLSYRKALQLITHINALYGEDLILTWKGGSQGGGAKLSERGLELLARYNALCAKVKTFLAGEKAGFFNP